MGFIEKVLSLAHTDAEQQMLEKQKKDTEDAAVLKELIAKADTDRSGLLSRDEFVAFMKDPRLRCFFEFRGLSLKDAVSFFEMMTASTGADVELGISDFVSGCIGMRGVASAMDVHSLGFEVKVMHARQQEQAALWLQQFAELKEAFRTLTVVM